MSHPVISLIFFQLISENFDLFLPLISDLRKKLKLQLPELKNSIANRQYEPFQI